MIHPQSLHVPAAPMPNKMVEPSLFNLPFCYKKYLTKKCSLRIKIKLSLCSKEFGKLSTWNRELSLLILNRFKREIFMESDNDIGVVLDLEHTFLNQHFPVKIKNELEFYILQNFQINELIPKLNISSLLSLKLLYCEINIQELKKLLVSSLKKIRIFRSTPVNFDLALFVMERLPAVEEIDLTWQPGISSFVSLMAIERVQKLKKFAFENLTEIIPLNIIKQFQSQHMESRCYVSLTYPRTVIQP